MPPLARALVDFGHLLGAALVVGTMVVLALAANDRRTSPPPKALITAGIALLVLTGLVKWLPYTGGVGWLGGRGIRTAFLHGKLVLALVVFHQAESAIRAWEHDPTLAKRRARVAASVGVLVMALACLHHWGI